MPIYDFKCSEGHVTEHRFPITSDIRETECPECGQNARRMISAPFTRRVDQSKAAAVESAQKSAYEPQVVNSVPRTENRKPTPVTRDPQHAKLPRP